MRSEDMRAVKLTDGGRDVIHVLSEAAFTAWKESTEGEEQPDDHWPSTRLLHNYSDLVVDVQSAKVVKSRWGPTSA